MSPDCYLIEGPSGKKVISATFVKNEFAPISYHYTTLESVRKISNPEVCLN